MAEVGPGRTDLPSVWNQGIEYAFDTERYSDDAVVPAATEEAFVETLGRQDAIAPKYRVRHVPSKEEYLYVLWRTGHGTTKALRHTEYGQAQRRTKRQGPWILGSQVLSDAAGTELRRRVRAGGGDTDVLLRLGCDQYRYQFGDLLLHGYGPGVLLRSDHWPLAYGDVQDKP